MQLVGRNGIAISVADPVLCFHRALSSSHPARQDLGFLAAAQASDAVEGVQQVSLKTLHTYRATLADSNRAANLQYSDLHGVPCLLVLCEKGRMGDTFPQTFGCLDLRIRTSDNHTTFIQEIGRLCQYPAVDSSNSSSSSSPSSGNYVSILDISVEAEDTRITVLQKALEFAYDGGKHVRLSTARLA